ncbi:MAG TPA: AzlD domain-containing protein [Ilumatobacteraceae bacterium]|nr:AzlD domain-containing protein [Ilumatobacteraceae bacterium]
MSWAVVLILGAGAYVFKVLGLVVIGDRSLPPVLERCIGLIPAALIAAIIVKDTFSVGKHLQIDARAAGIGTAVVLAWKRAPFIAVVLAGAAVTAVIRVLN